MALTYFGSPITVGAQIAWVPYRARLSRSGVVVSVDETAKTLQVRRVTTRTGGSLLTTVTVKLADVVLVTGA